MASTFTPNKNLELPGYNDYVNNWNVPVNADFSAIDTALGGSTLLNATAVSGDITLTSTQYRPSQLIISGTLTANVRYLVPAGVGGQWTITNNTTGAFTLQIASAAGGSNITLASGTTIVSCDGSASGMRRSISYNLVGNGGTGINAIPANGQILIGNGTGYTLSSLNPGAGISITNGPGSITINSMSLLFPGIVVPFAGSSAPSGWLICDGSAVSRSIYADLYNVITTIYGPGDGSTTFNLPNLTDRFNVGAGGLYALGSTGGATSVTTSSAGAHNHTGLTGGTAITTAQMPSHTHAGTTNTTSLTGGITSTASGGVTKGNFDNASGVFSVAGNSTPEVVAADGGSTRYTDISFNGSHNHTFTTSATGSGSTHDHSISTDGTHTHTVAPIPPYIALNYIIKT